MNDLHLIGALARSPRRGVTLTLAHGRLGTSVLLVALATAVAALAAARFAGEVTFQDFAFGSDRSTLVELLLRGLGRERTSVVLYLLERAWVALLVVTILTPAFYWLLGASAIHAAARMSGIRRPFAPMLVVIGYAAAIARIPADLASLALGHQSGIASLVGLVMTVWLVAVAFRAIQLHYGVVEGRAVTILVVAIVLFYLAPALLILAAVVAILVAAVVLDYFPG